jgi:hypothetical protein
MIVTWQNYRGVLPPNLWDRFKTLANQTHVKPIIYIDRVLRYATYDEYNPNT